MPNPRQELFAQALAQGKTADAAYKSAGYKPNRANACRLKANESVISRVLELRAKHQERFVLTRHHVIVGLIENIEKALGRRSVKVGADGKEVFVYRGDVANRAIQLAGLEVGMFVERKEAKHSFAFEKMSDVELVEILQQEAQALLEDNNEDGNGGSGFRDTVG